MRSIGREGFFCSPVQQQSRRGGFRQEEAEKSNLSQRDRRSCSRRTSTARQARHGTARQGKARHGRRSEDESVKGRGPRSRSGCHVE